MTRGTTFEADILSDLLTSYRYIQERHALMTLRPLFQRMALSNLSRRSLSPIVESNHVRNQHDKPRRVHWMETLHPTLPRRFDTAQINVQALNDIINDLLIPHRINLVPTLLRLFSFVTN